VLAASPGAIAGAKPVPTFAAIAWALPARTTSHEQVSLRPTDGVCGPAVQSSHALFLLNVRKPEMVSGLRTLKELIS